MITSQGELIRDLFCILDRETSGGGAAASTAACGGGYKIIVFFTTARLTGFMSELFNRVKVKRGERPTTTDDDETMTIPTHYDNDDDSD